MPCCGQKRDSLRINPTSHAVSSAAQSVRPSHQAYPAAPGQFASARPTNAGALTGPGAVVLQYTQASHIVVEGAVTRRRYEFSAAEPLQLVDCNDAAALLASRFFVRR